MSTLEASVARIDDLLKAQSAACTKSSESQRSLQKDHVSLQKSTQKYINCLTEILSTLTARLEQGCTQDDTPSQPEVSAVNKSSQGTSRTT